MKLFIFDFDHTIVKGHTHNAINRSKAGRGIEQEYVNAPWEVVHDLSTIGPESDWKEIFETLYQQGHFLSIASFNAYGTIIPEFLGKIGLSEELIAQIHISLDFRKIQEQQIRMVIFRKLSNTFKSIVNVINTLMEHLLKLLSL